MEELTIKGKEEALKAFRKWYETASALGPGDSDTMMHLVHEHKLKPAELFAPTPDIRNPAQLRIFSMFQQEPGTDFNRQSLERRISEMITDFDGMENSKEKILKLRPLVDAISELKTKGFIKGTEDKEESIRKMILELSGHIADPTTLHDVTHMANVFGDEIGGRLILPTELGDVERRIKFLTARVGGYADTLDATSAVQHLQYMGSLVTKPELKELTKLSEISLRGKLSKAKSMEDLEEFVEMLREIKLRLTLPSIKTDLKGEKVSKKGNDAIISKEGLLFNLDSKMNIETDRIEPYPRIIAVDGLDGSSLSQKTKDLIKNMTRIQAPIDVDNEGNIIFRIRTDEGLVEDQIPYDWSEMKGEVSEKIGSIVNSLGESKSAVDRQILAEKVLSPLNALLGIGADDLAPGVMHFIEEFPEGDIGWEQIQKDLGRFLVRHRGQKGGAKKELKWFSLMKAPIEEQIKKHADPKNLGELLNDMKTKIFSRIAHSGFNFKEISKNLTLSDTLSSQLKKIGGSMVKHENLDKFSEELTYLAHALDEAQMLEIPTESLKDVLGPKFGGFIDKAKTPGELKKLLEAYEHTRHTSLPPLKDFESRLRKQVEDFTGKRMSRSSLTDLVGVIHTLREHDLDGDLWNLIDNKLKGKVVTSLKNIKPNEMGMEYVDLLKGARKIGIRPGGKLPALNEDRLISNFIKKIGDKDARGLIEDLVKLEHYFFERHEAHFLNHHEALKGVAGLDKPLEERISDMRLLNQRIDSIIKKKDTLTSDLIEPVLEKAIASAREGNIRDLLKGLEDVHAFGFRCQKSGMLVFSDIAKAIDQYKTESYIPVETVTGRIIHANKRRMEELLSKARRYAQVFESERFKDMLRDHGEVGYIGDPSRPDGIAYPESIGGISAVTTNAFERGFPMQTIEDRTWLSRMTPVGEINHNHVLSAISLLRRKLHEGIMRREKMKRH